MKNITLRWAVKEPKKLVEEQSFDIEYLNDDERSGKELKLAQKLVSGYVEITHLGGDVKILCNEEGLLNNLKQNCGFVGTIVFIHEVMEDDDAHWGSLTNEDLRKVKNWAVLEEGVTHPDTIGKPLIISGDEAINEYRNKLHKYQMDKEQEWMSL